MGYLMSIGQSGRIIVEMDPELKKRLYSALAMDGTSLKKWFISNVETYVKEMEAPDYYNSEVEEK